jgi:hypothetical protein
MSTTKLKTPTGANGATAPNEPRNYRTNPETEARIDDWIQQYPKDWKYIMDMPVERLRRSIVLNDIRKTDAIERIDEEILKKVNDDPKRKQSYEVQTEGMTPQQRDEYIVKAERERRRITQPTNQSRKEGIGVGV